MEILVTSVLSSLCSCYLMIGLAVAALSGLVEAIEDQRPVAEDWPKLLWMVVTWPAVLYHAAKGE